MPGKGHKVASHQARLGQRRKRQGRGPSGIPQQPTTPVPSEGNETPTLSPAQPLVAPTRPAPRAQSQPMSAVYSYIYPELKRIAVLGGAMVIVLIVLSVIFG